MNWVLRNILHYKMTTGGQWFPQSWKPIQDRHAAETFNFKFERKGLGEVLMPLRKCGLEVATMFLLPWTLRYLVGCVVLHYVMLCQLLPQISTYFLLSPALCFVL